MSTQTIGNDQSQSVETQVNRIQKVNEDYAQKLMQVGQEISDENKVKYQQKLDGIKKFKKEIDKDVKKMIDFAIKIKDKIRLKVVTKQNDDGFLTHKIQEYFDCFTIDQDKLDSMLNKDIQQWQERLKKQDDRENKLKENFNRMLEDQKKFITNFIKEEQTLQTTIEKTNLSKLPQIGIGNYRIDFEWPTESDLKSMKFDQPLKLQKIEVWENKKLMSGIRVTLSNGCQSPIFKAVEGKQDNLTVMESNGDIRKIVAQHHYSMRMIELRDADDQNICRWDGGDRHLEKIQEIPANHHLIGIYGNNTESWFIESFGFIVAEYL